MSTNISSNSQPQKYLPIPRTLTVPTASYKKVIDDYVPKYGVKFNFFTIRESAKIEKKQETRLTSEPDKKHRKHDIKYIFKVYYYCHRTGEKRKRSETDQPIGGKSGKTRDLQKKSKKIGCQAKLVVTCPKGHPDIVVIEHIGDHNHEVGGLEDLQHLPLSNATKSLIMQRLREGYSKRDTRIAIQANFRNYIMANINSAADINGGSVDNFVVHRDQMVDANEIYNMYKKIVESFYKRADSQQESVRKWLEELNEQRYDTYIAANFNTTFSFGFLSPWQKALLLVSESVCMDATHSTTNIDKGILYTIVIRHPKTGTGCPVAFFFSTDHSMVPIKDFLYFLRFQVGYRNLKKITIDMSAAEHNAISAVYPGVDVQWCLFHVARAWMGKIREYIKLGSSSLNAEAHKSVIGALKKMMWEKSQAEFLVQLRRFIEDFWMYPEFLEYFKKKYLENDAFMHWSAAFQPQSFTNMETNNYVESWHNQLKTTYLQRKKNRRVDRLVYILVNDVLPDYVQNINRMYLNIGRMSPEERRRRERKMRAEAINEEVVGTMVTEASDLGSSNEEHGFRVNSFENENIYYEVIVEEEQMKSCNCADFTFNRIICKHMYLLKRVQRNILLFERKHL